jgi:tetratricopeptide (TPR) repeat protein
MRPLVAWFLVVALASAGAGVARADRAPDETAAQQHFERGERYFAVGRFADAIVEYQLAYDADPLPEFLFDLGQAHRNLRHYDEAIFAFRKYLRLKPDAENRAQVERLIADLETARAAERAIAPTPMTTSPPPPARPIYKRWWFWVGVGVVAAATTTAIVLTTQPAAKGVPSSDLGNLAFPP